MKLGDANTATLGFLPHAAFEEFARQRRMIAATESRKLLGYSLFSPSRRSIKLVHLCVDPTHRTQGVSRGLVSWLSAQYQDSDGIVAHCRVDYPADKVWPKLGFVAVAERPGRSRSGSTLRVWHLDHGHPTLFSSTPRDVPVVVMDANVVFDLQGPLDPETRESKALLSEWVREDLELTITEETNTEILRNSDQPARQKGLQFASAFPRVTYSSQTRDEVRGDLIYLFPHPRSASDESDLQQLSMSIAAGADFFVTRDGGLLGLAEELVDRWGIIVVRPAHLVALTDEERREARYRPARLAGSTISTAFARGDQLEQLIDLFQAYSKGETRAVVRRTLRTAASQPESHEAIVLSTTNGDPVALLVLDRSSPDVLRVPLLRVVRGKLDDILARHLLWQTVKVAATERRTRTVLHDSDFPRSLSQVFDVFGFHKSDAGLVKIHAFGWGSEQDHALYLASLSEQVGDLPFLAELARLVEERWEELPDRVPVALEMALWPAKIDAAPLANYLIPIRPRWAAALFESRIADQDLFAADPGLMLRTENVYYRSAHPPVLEAPGRILWYVTDEAGVPDSKQVAGCSYLREVVTGPATKVFSQFERLGVYQWDDVKAVAGGDSHGTVMAFRFSHTELFPHPVPLAELRSVVRECTGKTLALRSPVRLPKACFESIYSTGAGQP